jgi:hypothetical protein
MKKLDIPISPETSRSITLKEKWISQHTWTSSEEEVNMEIDDTTDTTTGLLPMAVLLGTLGAHLLHLDLPSLVGTLRLLFLLFGILMPKGEK